MDPFHTIVTFLENRIRALTVSENCASYRKPPANNNFFKSKTAGTIRSHLGAVTKNSVESSSVPSCDFCHESHIKLKCPLIIGKKPHDILALVRKINACRNCLRLGHMTRLCQVKTRCKICSDPHHTMLHMDKKNSSQSSIETSNKPTPNDATSDASTSSDETIHVNTTTIPSDSQPGLLGTISAIAYGQNCEPIVIRALFDPGAQCPFITIRCAKKLGLHLVEECTVLKGIGSIQSESRYSTKVKIGSRNLPDIAYEMNAIALETVLPPLPPRNCLLYTSPSPRDRTRSRMPSSA